MRKNYKEKYYSHFINGKSLFIKNETQRKYKNNASKQQRTQIYTLVLGRIFGKRLWLGKETADKYMLRINNKRLSYGRR